MKTKKHVEINYGYVVECFFAPRQGGKSMGFICDYGKAPAGFARAVGLGDLECALFIDSYADAENWAYWNMSRFAVVRSAKRINGRIELQ